MSAEQESGFSPGGFAAKVAAEDGRVTPGNLFASQAAQPLPPRSIPPMPGATPPPPPPLNPIFSPVTGAPAQPLNPTPPSAMSQQPQITPHFPAQSANTAGPVDPFAGATPPAVSQPTPPVPPVPPAVSQPTPPVPPVPPAVSQPTPPVPAVAAGGQGEPVSAVGFTTTVPDPILPPVPPAKQPSRLRRLAPFVAAPLVLILAGGAFAAYQVGVFGAPGDQPSAVVPATAFAYAAIDLNPSAEAKLGVYEFTRHFPSTKAVSKGSFKDDLLAKMFADVDDLDYATDVKPWMGDRAAVAAIPAPGTEAGIAPLVVIQHTDEEAAKKALDKAEKTANEPMIGDTASATVDEDLFDYAFKDDYVLVSTDANALKTALAAEDSLDDNTVYTTDKATLGGNALAHAWVDTAAMLKAMPAETVDELPATMKDRLDGSVIVGATVSGDYLQVAGHGTGYDLAATEPTRHLDALPADATAALAITGLGSLVTETWAQATDAGLTDELPQNYLGVTVPEGFAAILGTDLAIAAEVNQPAVKAVVTTDDPDTATAALDRLLNETDGLGITLNSTDDGYTATLNDWSSEKSLGENPTFIEAVPNTDGASMVAYVNLVPVIEQFTAMAADPSNQDLVDAKAFKAAGLSVNPTGTGVGFTFRLTVGD